MKASRLALPPGQSSRWTESSSVENSTRRSKRSLTSSKRKKSCQPSPSKVGNKCPPVLCTKGQAADLHATTNVDVPCSSDYDQAVTFPNLPDCQWPNWPDWGRETHEEHGGAAGPSWASNYSFSSSSCSYSDSESDLMWSTSSATSGSTSGNRAHEPREMPKTCSFWEDFIWGERKSWRKLQHKKSFLTHLWDFKPETKVEESSDPILVSVTVLGSPGPLRLVVDKNNSVQQTVDFALRSYTAQKREPELVAPTSCFGLYCRNPDFEALDDGAKIGHRENRQFHLYHKDPTLDDIATSDASSCKSDGARSLAPIRSWIWNNLNGMRSWAGNLAACISRNATFLVKCLNPWRFYRFMYIISVKALS